MGDTPYRCMEQGGSFLFYFSRRIGEGGKSHAGDQCERIGEDISGKAKGKGNAGQCAGDSAAADGGGQSGKRGFLWSGRGRELAFIGPNGAGKSTTIKMLTGILYPDGGRVEVLGIDPAKRRRQLAYQIGTVFGQKEQLWTHLTPYDNFRFFGAIYDIPEKETERRIGELVERFELGGFINTPVRNLSLGQRIRCEIVASLLHKPKVLFLDEPTIGLDPVVKESVRSLIKQMNREFNTTIFLTSHDVGDIEKLCKRIIIVNAGQIVLDDSMEHLKYHYLHKKIVEVKMQEETTLPQVEVNISNVPLENIIMEIYKAEGKDATS